MDRIKDLYVKMTNRCNGQCLYCFENCSPTADAQQLTATEIKEAIDIINPSKAVALTGGEPLLRYDDIIDIMNYSLDKGLRVRINTNGTIPIKDWALFKPGKGQYINFSVSLDGFKDLHEQYRGQGTYDRVLDFARQAIQNGNTVFVSSTLPIEIYRDEPEYLRRFINFTRNFGFAYNFISIIRRIGRGKSYPNATLADYQAMVANINNLHDSHAVAGLCVTCQKQKNHAVLDTDGTLKMRCQYLNFPLCHYRDFTPDGFRQRLQEMDEKKLGYYDGELVTEKEGE